MLLSCGILAGGVAYLVVALAPAPSPSSVVARDSSSVQAKAGTELAKAPDRPGQQVQPVKSLKPNAPGKDGQLAKEMLDYLKALTVYIKIDAGDVKGSASGFFVKVDGDTGYIVTNEHVVNPKVPESERAAAPAPPGVPRIGPRRIGPIVPRMGPPNLPQPRIPHMPAFPPILNPPDLPGMGGMPGFPGFPVFEQTNTARKARANLTIVIGSGTSAERSLPAEVLDADDVQDLALIRVKGVNLPKPIDLSDRAELSETMTAYVLGFPLGAALAVEGDPVVTVNKSTVAAVRKNKSGMPVYVQLQAGRNPGNSGGPVVDADGRLVGIWVGSFEGTQIGLALAPPLLDGILKRTKANLETTTVKAGNDDIEIQFAIEVFDLLSEISGVRLLYAPGKKLAENPALLDSGEYAVIPDTLTLDLKGNGRRYTGRLTIGPRDMVDNQIPLQVAYVRRDGSVHYGKPWSYRPSAKGEDVVQQPQLAKANPPGTQPVSEPVPESWRPDLTVDLPDKIDMATVGGGGRFLIISMPARKQLVIFDLKEAKIATTLTFPESKFLFAANHDHLIIHLPGENVFDRWSLETFEYEATVPNPVSKEIKAIAMGSASVGPLVIYAPGAEPTTLDLSLFDPVMLKQGEWKFDPIPTSPWGIAFDPAKYNLNCSADGQVITARSAVDFVLLSRSGSTYQSHRIGGVNMALPSANGQSIICNGQAFSSEGKSLAPNRTRHGAAIWGVPALQGGLDLTFNETRTPNNPVYLKLTLHADGDAEPLVSLPKKIDTTKGLVDWTWGTTQPWDRHVFLAPEFGVMGVIPAEKNRIELYRFDLDRSLKESKRDYLFVLSQPPPEATKGSTYRYPVIVKSKKGDVKLKLDAAPRGMKLEGESTIAWDVPADYADKDATVTLSIQDGSSQVIRHHFQMHIMEHGENKPPK
jgi:S1-C subfamily serine protease